jgi:Asp-tRNA(Asn)/Glu-tRNA(Gln) amidotransferase A subunit family amidase
LTPTASANRKIATVTDIDLLRPRSLTADVAALASGRYTLRDHIDATCDRIDEVDPRLHAFVPEPGRRSRLQAEAAAPAPHGPHGPAPHGPSVADLPWHGVPVAVKDIVRVDGLPTRAGSDLPAEVLAGPEASVVRRLRAAGALIAGKTVTAEFAVLAPGPTRNPHDPAHTPGGSSSGSAAAVAAGMVPLALGTQTLGSIVRPAAYCGVVGFKPTYGRVPVDGVIANTPSLDALGWFTLTVTDAAAAAAVLCPDWRPVPTADRCVLGVPAEAYLSRATADAVAAFEARVTALRGYGFEVRRTGLLTEFDELERRLLILNRRELADVHARWFAEHEAAYRPQTAAAIRVGRRVTDAEYAESLRYKESVVADLARVSADEGIDVWITPAATRTAPPGLESTGDPVMSMPFSCAGVPVVSVPAGFDAAGLPWGVQCAGRHGGDERLLAAAVRIERVLASFNYRSWRAEAL